MMMTMYELWSEHIYPIGIYIEFIDWYAWSGNANKWIENHLDNGNTEPSDQYVATVCPLYSHFYEYFMQNRENLSSIFYENMIY